MKHWICAVLAMFAASIAVHDAFSQEQRPQGARGSGSNRQGTPGNSRQGSSAGSRPGATGSSTLERAGLKVGQQMPDVTVFDANGEEFPISRVKGKYAVLVFGCLT